MAASVQYRLGGIKRLGDHAIRVSNQLRDLSDPFMLMGIRLQGTREEIFERQGDPIPWKPSGRAINDEGQTLVDTRALLNSLTSSASPGAYLSAGTKRLEVGTTLNYANIHDEGGTVTAIRGGKSFTMTMPQRKFLNLRIKDLKAMEEVMETWMNGIFDGEEFVA
jgi:phage gpG-like protein